MPEERKRQDFQKKEQTAFVPRFRWNLGTGVQRFIIRPKPFSKNALNWCEKYFGI